MASPDHVSFNNFFWYWQRTQTYVQNNEPLFDVDRRFGLNECSRDSFYFSSQFPFYEHTTISHNNFNFKFYISQFQRSLSFSEDLGLRVCGLLAWQLLQGFPNPPWPATDLLNSAPADWLARLAIDVAQAYSSPGPAGLRPHGGWSRISPVKAFVNIRLILFEFWIWGSYFFVGLLFWTRVKKRRHHAVLHASR